MMKNEAAIRRGRPDDIESTTVFADGMALKKGPDSNSGQKDDFADVANDYGIDAEDEFMIGSPIVSKPRTLSRIYNRLNRIARSQKAQDMAAGMLVSGVWRWGVFGVGTAVGLTGLPIIATSAIGAAVARTAFTVGMDYHRYKKTLAENDEKLSFWNFVGQNKKKYLLSLGAGTAFATLGATFMTYAMPAIEHWAAPVIDRVMQSQTVTSLMTAFAGLVGKPDVPVPTDTVKGVVTASKEALGGHVVPVAPAPTISDKITAIVKDQHLSHRWQAIAERAIDGNAQDQKDIASALLNGTHGFHKDAGQAVELYRAAANAGNMQAKVDLAYMQFHGLGGMKVDHQAATTALRDYAQSNKYAGTVLNHLTGHAQPAGETLQRVVENAPKIETPVMPAAPATVVSQPFAPAALEVTDTVSTAPAVAVPAAAPTPQVGQAFNCTISGNAAQAENFTGSCRLPQGFKPGDKFQIEIPQLVMLLK